MRKTIYGLLFVVVCLAQTAAAQTLASYGDNVQALMARPEITAALNFVDGNRAETLREWIAITEINAPSGKEQ